MFSDASIKLESCCVAIEKARQDFELLESKKQERLQRRAEIENKIEEDKRKFRNTVETTKSLCETQIRLSRHNLEQSLTTSKGREIKEEVNLLRIERKELFAEIEHLKSEINDTESEMGGEAQQFVEERDEEKQGEKIVRNLQQLLDHNLHKLEEEQMMLSSILDNSRNYLNKLQRDLGILDEYCSDMETKIVSLEETILKNQVRTAIAEASSRNKSDQESRKFVEDMKFDNGVRKEGDLKEKLEIELAEKFCQLESLQNILDGNKEMMTKLAMCKKDIKEDNGDEDLLDLLLEKLQRDLAEIEVNKELKPTDELSELDSSDSQEVDENSLEEEEVIKELGKIVDNLVENVDIISNDIINTPGMLPDDGEDDDI